jgi:hypothetical protein
MQVSFDQSGFVPIYNQLTPLEVQINDKSASIVDFNVQSTGYYWAPIDELTFLLPQNQQN